MPIKRLIERLLGDSSTGVEVRTFECDDCGHTFDSAKQPDRAQCMECLSNDVTVTGSTQRE